MIIFGWFGLMLIYSNSLAQDLSNRTFDLSYASIYDEYSNIVGKSGRLYNGLEYAFDDIQIRGHPFLDRKLFLRNTIVYDGFTYTDIEIMYDVYRDQLVMAHEDEYGAFARIALYSERVNGFTYQDRTFIRLSEVSAGIGFYEILYQGELQVLAKRMKKTRPSKDELYQYEFHSSDIYFIRKGLFYHQVKSRGDVYAVFGEEKKALKTYAKKNDIHKMKFELFMKAIAESYDLKVIDL